MKNLILFLSALLITTLLQAQTASHDVMVKSILVAPTYSPGTDFIPRAVIKNLGISLENFNATCEIKTVGADVYSQSSVSVNLAAGEEETITFPDYLIDSPNDLYEITITTYLNGDVDLANNSITESFNTYTIDREMVILEIATGTWCTYCPGAQMGGEDLVNNGHSVTVIEHHNGDGFVTAYSNARIQYYGITGLPTAVFDGVEMYVGGNHTTSMYAQYLPIYQSRMQIPCAFTVDVFGEHTGLNYNIILKLEKVAVIPPDWNNLVVHLTLTETNIPFSWQGQTEVDFCERLMIPNQNGTSVDMINNTIVEVPLQFTMDASWVLDNCEIGAFIQNLNTKEVLQGSKVKITELLPVPVELTSFTAEEFSNGVMLKWTTASELNNRGFEIERSTDNENFSSVGFVPGNGTTTEQNKYTFVDNININTASSFYYRLKQIDFDGRFTYSDVVEFNVNRPKEFVLQQNYPNPFNPTTVINYVVPQTSPVSIKLYDLTGQEVAVLVNEVKESGTYRVTLDAKNLASGVYIYRMIAGDFTSVKKMNVLK